jgi:hypothetical protein
MIDSEIFGNRNQCLTMLTPLSYAGDELPSELRVSVLLSFIAYTIPTGLSALGYHIGIIICTSS